MFRQAPLQADGASGAGQMKKGDDMRAAVAYDNGNVFPHFGMTSEFKFYEIEDGKVVSTWIKDTGGAKHHEIVAFLKNEGVGTLICGDIATCYADCTKAAKVLGWKAEKTLVDMCRDGWRWQKQNPNGYESN